MSEDGRYSSSPVHAPTTKFALLSYIQFNSYMNSIKRAVENSFYNNFDEVRGTLAMVNCHIVV